MQPEAGSENDVPASIDGRDLRGGGCGCEPALRSAKYEAAKQVLDTLPEAGGRIQLSKDEALAWLKALNDVRLALGVRLGVTEEFEQDWAKLKPDDPQWTAYEVYAWLGAVQESLVQALA